MQKLQVIMLNNFAITCKILSENFGNWRSY